MSIIIPANSAVSGGFDVDNSLMFASGDSAYLNRAGAGGASIKKMTYSFWVKRGLLGATENIMSFYNSGTDYLRVYFNDTDRLTVKQQDGGTIHFQVIPLRQYRDVSAWYHIVVAIDTTQSTAANRLKIYTNGVQVTSFDTASYPSQDRSLKPEAPKFIGSHSTANYFDGLMAEFAFIVDTQNAQTDFGEFDEDTGIWKPIDVSGLTFGTNGFYLDFEDSSALGNDANGSNNFTVNNIAATDQGIDTCTNNFSTLNLLATSSFCSLSQGNTRAVGNTSGNSGETFSTFSTGNSGKWYYEMKATGVDGVDNPNFGFMQTARGFRLQNGEPGLGGASSGSLDIRVQPDGKTFDNGSASGSAVISTYTAGDILGFAIDSDNGAFYVAKNGTWQTSGNPESGSSRTGAIKTWSPTDSKVTEGQSVCIGVYKSSSIVDANFGSPYYAISSGNSDADGFGNFEYAVPSGYFSLCTKNLAEHG